LGEAIGKEAAKKLLRLHAHLINHMKRLCLLG